MGDVSIIGSYYFWSSIIIITTLHFHEVYYSLEWLFRKWFLKLQFASEIFYLPTSENTVLIMNGLKCWNVFYWSKNNIIQYLNHFNLQTKKNRQKQFTSCAYQFLSMEWIFCQIIVIPCFALGSFCSQGMQIPLFPYHPLHTACTDF